MGVLNFVDCNFYWAIPKFTIPNIYGQTHTKKKVERCPAIHCHSKANLPSVRVATGHSHRIRFMADPSPAPAASSAAAPRAPGTPCALQFITINDKGVPRRLAEAGPWALDSAAGITDAFASLSLGSR
jgi:hypothetical protein